MGLNIVLTTDGERFAGRVRDFLAQRVERNVLATVLAGARAGAYPDARPLFAFAEDERGEVRMAALRTHPWPLLVSELEPALAPRLVEMWLEADPALPGVTGVLESARAVASAWHAQTGTDTHCRMRQALHTLDEVRDPQRPAAGALRLPAPEERPLLVAWNEAFAREAGLPVLDSAEAMVDHRLRHDGLLIWDHDGPASMVGVNLPVAGVVRLGPVYTPPELRRRGYAGTAVATASRRALGQGATNCILFTDLDNPTSNKIYAEVGYRRTVEWEEHSFAVP